MAERAHSQAEDFGRADVPASGRIEQATDAASAAACAGRRGIPAGALSRALVGLQRSAGNAATGTLLQRHSVADYPEPAPPEEQEEVDPSGGSQVSRVAVQRRFGDRLRDFGRQIGQGVQNVFGLGAKAPPQVPGQAPQAPPQPGPAVGQAPQAPPQPGPAVGQAPQAPPQPVPAVGQAPQGPIQPPAWTAGVAPAQPPARGRLGGQRPLPPIGAMTFSAASAVADGATTVKAAVPTAGVTWVIEGQAHGSTVAADGTITPGANLGQDQAVLALKATDPVDPTRFSRGALPIVSQAVATATIDLAAFLAKSPKAIGFKTGLNGHFDLVYNPTAKLADVNVRVHFSFLDPALPGEKAADKKKREDTYRADYTQMVQQAWGKRYQFATKKQPNSVWSALNPVTVAVNITEDAATPHFTINVSAANQGGAFVQGPKANVGSSLAPVPFANAAGFSAHDDEINRVKKILPEVTFPAGSPVVPPDRVKELTSAAHYLRRINVPKFALGAAGGPDAGGAPDLGDARAKAVCAALGGPGLGVHTTTAAGGGPAGKVTVTPTVPGGFTNMQDVTNHEFGHMIGLDDEYQYQNEKRKGLSNYPLVEEALGKEYADRTTRYDLTVTSASVMQSGNDVRIQHYVTFWEALGQATQNAGAPATPLTRADWEFIG